MAQNTVNRQGPVFLEKIYDPQYVEVLIHDDYRKHNRASKVVFSVSVEP